MECLEFGFNIKLEIDYATGLREGTEIIDGISLADFY